jgi:hypothetical protein
LKTAAVNLLKIKNPGIAMMAGIFLAKGLHGKQGS